MPLDMYVLETINALPSNHIFTFFEIIKNVPKNTDVFHTINIRL